jgi:hypothetical protein
MKQTETNYHIMAAEPSYHKQQKAFQEWFGDKLRLQNQFISDVIF